MVGAEGLVAGLFATTLLYGIWKVMFRRRRVHTADNKLGTDKSYSSVISIDEPQTQSTPNKNEMEDELGKITREIREREMAEKSRKHEAEERLKLEVEERKAAEEAQRKERHRLRDEARRERLEQEEKRREEAEARAEAAKEVARIERERKEALAAEVEEQRRREAEEKRLAAEEEARRSEEELAKAAEETRRAAEEAATLAQQREIDSKRDLEAARAVASEDTMGAAKMVLSAIEFTEEASEEIILDELSRDASLAVLKHLDEATISSLSADEKIALARIALWAGENRWAEKLGTLGSKELLSEGREVDAAHGFVLVGECRRVRGARKLAIQAYQRALATAKGDSGVRCRSHWGLGTTSLESGLVNDAERFAHTSLSAAEENKDKRGLADVSRLHGSIQLRRGSHDDAEEKFKESMFHASQIGDSLRISRAATNLGVARLESGRYGEAIEALEQSLVAKEEVGDRVGSANVHYNLGLVFLAMSRREDAEERFNLAYEIAQATSNRPVQVQAGMSLAELLMSKGDPRTKQLLQTVVETATEIGDHVRAAEARRFLR